jgi:hypothetical protein
MLRVAWERWGGVGEEGQTQSGAARSASLPGACLTRVPGLFLSPGVRLGGQLEDPRLAGALLWPAASEEAGGATLELKRLQAAAAPKFKARREGGRRAGRRLAAAVLPACPLPPACPPICVPILHHLPPSLQARVPNLCRSGVTASCRAAVLSLACMDPLKQMLAHRRMLEARRHARAGSGEIQRSPRPALAPTVLQSPPTLS